MVFASGKFTSPVPQDVQATLYLEYVICVHLNSVSPSSGSCGMEMTLGNRLLLIGELRF